MEIAIRNIFIAIGLGLIHRYLEGDGNWISHHLAYDVIVSIAGVILALLAIAQFIFVAIAIVVTAMRGELR